MKLTDERDDENDLAIILTIEAFFVRTIDINNDNNDEDVEVSISSSNIDDNVFFHLNNIFEFMSFYFI